MPLFKLLRRIIAVWLIFSFFATSITIPNSQAGEITQPMIPAPGDMLSLSAGFTPAHLMGMTIHPENALKFDFLIHKGDGNLTEIQKKQEYTTLVKYFLASLTIPDRDQWVNLSPYEHDRIIAHNFGKTEMGRDLLAEDYLLKQITSSLIYPESGLGKEFWDKVYAKAWEQYHTTTIPVNSFNKVWIVPDQATVYETHNTAYIIQTHLKVMLEEDYLSLQKHASRRLPGDMYNQNYQSTCPQAACQANLPLNVKAPQGNNLTPNSKDVNKLGSNLIRQIILPALEKEVNQGKNFAQLRQIVSGMVLATWYKKRIKESILTAVYENKNKIQGLVIPDSSGVIPAKAGIHNQNIEYIYQQYLKAFKKGIYNYIKEDEDKYSHQSVPRKYFSGGFNRMNTSVIIVNRETISNPLKELLAADFAQSSAVDEVSGFLVSREMPSKPKPHQIARIPEYQRNGVAGVTLVHAPLLTSRIGFLFQKEINWNKYWKNIFAWPVNPLKTKGIENYPVIIPVVNNYKTINQIRSNIIRAAEKGSGLFVIAGGGVGQWLYKNDRFKWIFNIIPEPHDIFRTLQEIQSLKESGQIPQDMPVYVAWNPNDPKDTPQRLLDKIKAGATGVLTQPPFFWDQFKASLKVIRKSNPTIPIQIGVPIFDDADNAAYWMKVLLGIDWTKPENKEIGDIVRSLQDNEKKLTKEEFKEFRIQWTLNFIKRLRDEDKNESLGVSGIHLLPMRQETAFVEVLSRADLIPQAVIQEDIENAINELKSQGIKIRYEPTLTSNDTRSRRFREALISFKDAVSQIHLENPNLKIQPFTVRWNWIFSNEKRQHFHPDVDIVYRKDEAGNAAGFEMDVDLFQVRNSFRDRQTVLFKNRLSQALRGEYIPGIRLEERFLPHSESISWQFNEAFWKKFDEYVEDYRITIGGSPDINPEFNKYMAERLWPRLKKGVEADPNRILYYLEMGVASGDHIIQFLKAMAELARNDGRIGLLKHLSYVLSDFSPEALKKAGDDLRKAGAVELEDHSGYEFMGAHITTVLTNAENPDAQLSRFKGNIFLYHATNVYDTVPADQIALRDGRFYHKNTRPFLPLADFDLLVEKYGLNPIQFKNDLEEIGGKGVQTFLDTYQRAIFKDRIRFYAFWKDLWKALRLEEELTPVKDPSIYDYLNEGTGDDFDMYLSNRAIEGLRKVRDLLDPDGNIELVDVFNPTIKNYYYSVEPLQYDGSEVLYPNLTALRHAFNKYHFTPLTGRFKIKGPYGIFEIYADAEEDRAMQAAQKGRTRRIPLEEYLALVKKQNFNRPVDIILKEDLSGKGVPSEHYPIQDNPDKIIYYTPGWIYKDETDTGDYAWLFDFENKKTHRTTSIYANEISGIDIHEVTDYQDDMTVGEFINMSEIKGPPIFGVYFRKRPPQGIPSKESGDGYLAQGLKITSSTLAYDRRGNLDVAKSQVFVDVAHGPHSLDMPLNPSNVLGFEFPKSSKNEAMVSTLREKFDELVRKSKANEKIGMDYEIQFQESYGGITVSIVNTKIKTVMFSYHMTPREIVYGSDKWSVSGPYGGQMSKGFSRESAGFMFRLGVFLMHEYYGARIEYFHYKATPRTVASFIAPAIEAYLIGDKSSLHKFTEGSIKIPYDSINWDAIEKDLTKDRAMTENAASRRGGRYMDEHPEIIYRASNNLLSRLNGGARRIRIIWKPGNIRPDQISGVDSLAQNMQLMGMDLSEGGAQKAKSLVWQGTVTSTVFRDRSNKLEVIVNAETKAVINMGEVYQITDLDKKPVEIPVQDTVEKRKHEAPRANRDQNISQMAQDVAIDLANQVIILSLATDGLNDSMKEREKERLITDNSKVSLSRYADLKDEVMKRLILVPLDADRLQSRFLIAINDGDLRDQVTGDFLKAAQYLVDLGRAIRRKNSGEGFLSREARTNNQYIPRTESIRLQLKDTPYSEIPSQRVARFLVLERTFGLNLVLKLNLSANELAIIKQYVNLNDSNPAMTIKRDGSGTGVRRGGNLNMDEHPEIIFRANHTLSRLNGGLRKIRIIWKPGSIRPSQIMGVESLAKDIKLIGMHISVGSERKTESLVWEGTVQSTSFRERSNKLEINVNAQTNAVINMGEVYQITDLDINPIEITVPEAGQERKPDTVPENKIQNIPQMAEEIAIDVANQVIIVSLATEGLNEEIKEREKDRLIGLNSKVPLSRNRKLKEEVMKQLILVPLDDDKFQSRFLIAIKGGDLKQRVTGDLLKAAQYLVEGRRIMRRSNGSEGMFSQASGSNFKIIPSVGSISPLLLDSPYAKFSARKVAGLLVLERTSGLNYVLALNLSENELATVKRYMNLSDSNPAMSPEDNGGIDLNSANMAMTIKRDGKGVPLALYQQDMTQLNLIEGFVPVITEIKPARLTDFSL